MADDDKVLLEHPNLNNKRVTVRARAVDAWTNAGWRAVKTEDGKGATHHVVLAATRDEAMAWAKDKGVPQRAVTYASTADRVRALSADGLEVVELPSFTGHRHEAEIRTAIATVFTPDPQPAPAGSQDAPVPGSSDDDTQE